MSDAKTINYNNPAKFHRVKKFKVFESDKNDKNQSEFFFRVRFHSHTLAPNNNIRRKNLKKKNSYRLWQGSNIDRSIHRLIIA